MDEMEEWIPRALDAGVKGVMIWFFIGMPQQSPKSVMETVEYCRHILEKFKGKKVLPLICPMVPFLDPGSRFFEHPEKHGYKVYHRTLEEHRQAMVEPLAGILDPLACKGAGEELVEMVFLADVALTCEVCGGSRYRAEILEVRYRERNIREVLELTVDEAIRFFLRQDRIGERLWQLQRVGLGYVRLGQPATTLSGGEAQRLKVARELAANRAVARRLYILDEPTVGLGLSELARLVDVLDELVEAGGSVLVVEHNLEVIARADWVIDLGPEAADAGGTLMAEGPPEAVAAEERSHTGRYLRTFFDGGRAAAANDELREGDRYGDERAG